MRRFHWPLQKLLDVTLRREEMLRSEVLSLSQQMVQLRHEIIRRQAAARMLLSEFQEWPFEDRLAHEAVVMAWFARDADGIAKLRQTLASTQERRDAKTSQLLKIRSSRKTLQRRRQDALDIYLRDQRRLEQKVLDEAAQVRFVLSARHERARSAT